MPFAKKQRYCREFKSPTFYKPDGIPISALEVNLLQLDELEAINLCDYHNLNQTEAATQMKVSTSSLQRLLYSGRKKIAEALYGGKAIQIQKHSYISYYDNLE